MQKKLKRILTLCLCALLAVIPLSGVKESFAVQNIEKSAMVKSIGLDREDGAQLSFVTSVINDSSAFHEQSLISAAGENFSQAEQQAQILADKYLTFSYAKHYLIGLPSAERGIASIVEYLLSSPVVQLSSYLYLCEGAAKQMLESISRDSISTNEVLTNLNLAGKEEGYYNPVSLLECARALEEGTCFALPVIGAKEEGENTAKKTVLVFKGYALLQGGRVCARLNREQSRAMNLLGEKPMKTVVSCKGADLAIKREHCRVEFVRQGAQIARVRFHLTLRESLAAVQSEAAGGEALLRETAPQAEQILLEQLQELFTLLERAKADALGLQQALEIESGGKERQLQPVAGGIKAEVEFSAREDNHFNLQ